MAVVRWDPFGEMLRMQREMERMLSRFGEAPREREARVDAVAWMPKIDVKASGEDIVVLAELPGVAPDDVEVEVTDDVLTIKGERKAQLEDKDEGWLVCETCYGAFERSIALPSGVDASAIEAEFDNGVLKIRVPKALEAAKPKTTKIEIGTK
ncbi:MAG: Hsp20/alpha crystallin family protein [Coriobacteriia bacterium]|nr:Hsp20/alpha crystallin family protein [Coriobacteriia bacterium]MDI6843392.1 Hsp20/alpha crystallin family protein [Anaerosomatales bacterium]GAV32208.1 molecular chaperone [Coriobacteriaceae bacterium EMTCatB1]